MSSYIRSSAADVRREQISQLFVFRGRIVEMYPPLIKRFCFFSGADYLYIVCTECTECNQNITPLLTFIFSRVSGCWINESRPVTFFVKIFQFVQIQIHVHTKVSRYHLLHMYVTSLPRPIWVFGLERVSIVCAGFCSPSYIVYAASSHPYSSPRKNSDIKKKHFNYLCHVCASLCCPLLRLCSPLRQLSHGGAGDMP